MSIKKIKKEYKETPKKEIGVVFISNKVDIAVLLSYLAYYFFVGRVVNRPKYVTSLGKFIVFPVSAALGAFTGYKLAQFVTPYL